MFFLGISAGIPILLIFSSLSLWLREAGVDRAAVTFFSWAALGYSFKFVWAPLVDRLPVPWLGRRLGRRRAWMLSAQMGIIAAIVWMAWIDPAEGEFQLTLMAVGAVLLGFSSATQDIVIDAYRIESAKAELQALMSSTYIAGYRIGMLIAGAGALYLATYFGSDKEAYSYLAWQATYSIMAGVMLIGVFTCLVITEPMVDASGLQDARSRDYLGFLGLFVVAVLAFIAAFVGFGDLIAGFVSAGAVDPGVDTLTAFTGEVIRLLCALLTAAMVSKGLLSTGLINRQMVTETYVEPVGEFFRRYGLKTALLLLALVGLYRISDIVLGVISNVFYQDLDFSKVQIATVVKTFGLAMKILGGVLGGLLSMRYGVLRILFVGALLTVVTNLFFIILAVMGNSEVLLYLVISADNLTAGLASAAFVAFLSSLTNVRFTAVQYAIFSSLMTLIPKVIGGYSGTLVDAYGYVTFFVIAALLGLPVLLLVWIVGRRVELAPLEIKP